MNECPKCRDHGKYETHADHAHPQPRYFIAPDVEDEPTLWDRTPDPWNDTEPLALVRRCDVRPETWALITADPVLAAVNPDYTAVQTPALAPAWCPECRTRRPVTETFTSGHQERHGEVQYGVTLLDCGHSLQGPPTVLTAAPGAPYAPLGRLDGGDQPHVREDQL